jgi:hypothetical protein
MGSTYSDDYVAYNCFKAYRMGFGTSVESIDKDWEMYKKLTPEVISIWKKVARIGYDVTKRIIEDSN